MIKYIDKYDYRQKKYSLDSQVKHSLGYNEIDPQNINKIIDFLCAIIENDPKLEELAAKHFNLIKVDET